MANNNTPLIHITPTRAPAGPKSNIYTLRVPLAGRLSNAVIQRRNGGVRHQFADSIGGHSSNYR